MDEQSVAGSMAQLMASGDELVDQWVHHAKQYHATSPELVAQLMMNMDLLPNKTSVLAVMLATSIQRLAGHE